MAIRYPAVAGTFYEAGAEALRETVTSHLDAAYVESAPERVAALVVPHAGFIYSGATAGHALARARGKRAGRVLILGRSHRQQFDGAVVPMEDRFRTPLGELAVDRAFIERMGDAVCFDAASAHTDEHCLEVILPFVQVALGEVPIVPILFGTDPGESHIQLGERLAGMLDASDLVIASTDLSHYLTEERANVLDQAALNRVLSRDCHALIEDTNEGVCSMCGAAAVVCTMACSLARGARDWRILHYSTSARASGDHHRVVGYGAVSMEWGD